MDERTPKDFNNNIVILALCIASLLVVIVVLLIVVVTYYYLLISEMDERTPKDFNNNIVILALCIASLLVVIVVLLIVVVTYYYFQKQTVFGFKVSLQLPEIIGTFRRSYRRIYTWWTVHIHSRTDQDPIVWPDSKRVDKAEPKLQLDDARLAGTHQFHFHRYKDEEPDHNYFLQLVIDLVAVDLFAKPGSLLANVSLHQRRYCQLLADDFSRMVTKRLQVRSSTNRSAATRSTANTSTGATTIRTLYRCLRTSFNRIAKSYGVRIMYIITIIRDSKICFTVAHPFNYTCLCSNHGAVHPSMSSDTNNASETSVVNNPKTPYIICRHHVSQLYSITALYVICSAAYQFEDGPDESYLQETRIEDRGPIHFPPPMVPPYSEVNNPFFQPQIESELEAAESASDKE
ncbi:hypothetical protein CLF_105919 [Clonorchis sinensis]|uniref:Uncharacterized protein n=1 Tax=Clonorchis sinensis TaxID=79923 RepID=G7YEE6_CLOSI|nr:hypothetical protein CLF_105919 [Clonorchis sinensis]